MRSTLLCPRLAPFDLAATTPRVHPCHPFNLPAYRTALQQVKQLLLQQPEIYELEVNEQAFRRPGAKPYNQLRKEHLAEVGCSHHSQ